MSRKNRVSPVPSTTAVAELPPVEATITAPKSIRALVRSGLLAGVPRAEIAAAILAHFPTSQAAAKSSVHISWYAGRMRKEGLEVPKVAPARKTTTVEVASA